MSAGRAASGFTAEAESHMDEAAFREFYYQTAPGLRAFIYRACGDAALADDLLQDAFYRFLHADLPPLRAAADESLPVSHGGFAARRPLAAGQAAAALEP